MTRAVLGTVRSRTVYSGGSSDPSDPSDVSGSSTSRGLGFGFATRGSDLGAAVLGLSSLRRPSSGELAKAVLALLAPEPTVAFGTTGTAADALPASALNRDLGPAPLPVRFTRARSSSSGRDSQSFLSFQPELTNASDMGRGCGGALGAKLAWLAYSLPPLDSVRRSPCDGSCHAPRMGGGPSASSSGGAEARAACDTAALFA
mmetsp:Transcript_20206/g.53905  ORF Transcript_20206/g.53905 Transcript_20206/m.53905 type:complete len:203 (+) Transcript_20206:461-1069(+)